MKILMALTSHGVLNNRSTKSFEISRCLTESRSARR